MTRALCGWLNSQRQLRAEEHLSGLATAVGQICKWRDVFPLNFYGFTTTTQLSGLGLSVRHQGMVGGTEMERREKKIHFQGGLRKCDIILSVWLVGINSV